MALLHQQSKAWHSVGTTAVGAKHFENPTPPTALPEPEGNVQPQRLADAFTSSKITMSLNLNLPFILDLL